MARIRTIKPEFFRHIELFEAEQKSGLPLRLAFAGLWIVSDREGRFRWQPRVLKLDCLPHDSIDFDSILETLLKHGFVRRYKVGEDSYGDIPSWKKHQQINVRESESRIPPHPDQCVHMPDPVNALDLFGTKHVHACGEKEKEKEKENDREKERKRIGLVGSSDPTTGILDRFDEFWAAYPKRQGTVSKLKSKESWEKALTGGNRRYPKPDKQEIIDGARRYAIEMRAIKKEGTPFVMMPETWLNQRRWEGETNAAQPKLRYV